MAEFTLLVILSALAGAPSDERPVAVKEVYRCDFDAAVDQDYDGWPDGWTRRRGPGFPNFVKIGIERKESGVRSQESGDRSQGAGLKIALDGGGGEVTSPLIPISPHYSFELSANVKTSGLVHDGAWLTLTLVDRAGKTLESHDSPLVAGTSERDVRIGPITPASRSTTHATITFHLAPRGKDVDLAGSATLSDLLIVRLPRMSLHANHPTHLYAAKDAAEIRCEVSGIPELFPAVTFEVFDHADRPVATHRQMLKSYSDIPSPDGFAGEATWKPPLPGYGFFRVRASLHSRDRMVLERAISLVVLRPMPAPDRGEFGWTLPAEDRPLPPAALATLLGQVGIHWAKLPVWFDASQPARAESIASFAEQASIQGVELVGLLDQPPAELREVFREQGRLPIASVFVEPQLWGPAVSPVMTRLSLKIRWWQLGDDTDASYVGYQQLPEQIAQIKKQLEEYGQELKLGLSWRWPYEAPRAAAPPWAYLSYSAEPALTAEELGEYLASTKLPLANGLNAGSESSSANPAAKRGRDDQRNRGTYIPRSPHSAAQWLVLTPLPRGEYSTSVRARDLVARMVAAKIHGAEAVFVPEPFHDEHGLMNADATPSELLLPWRTTSRLLSGTEYLGQIQLPGGSTNHVFARGNTAVMVVWNDRPAKEPLAAGSDLAQLELWGASTPLALVESGKLAHHEIEVGPVPTFVTGLSAAVARWQIGLSFADSRLASVFGREQIIHLLMPNTFSQGVGGELVLHAPKSWSTDLRPVRFKLADGEQLKLPLPVHLLADANSGPQPVRLEFDITADRNYRFSVYRTLQLGLEDVQIELSTRLREDGALLVEQHLTNLSDQAVSFQCSLFPPGRRRETRQVIDLPRGRNTLTFILPQGEELLGQKLRLRAEEIRGPRVLNYSLTAER